MKKIVLLIMMMLFLMVGVQFYWESPMEQGEPLAYRFTFVCPSVGKGLTAGIAAADEALGTDTKRIEFENFNEEELAYAVLKAVYANVDGIIMVGRSTSDALPEAIEQAEKEEIPVILVDSDLPDSGRDCYIGADNQEAGAQAGRVLLESTEGQAHIAVVASSLSDANQKERLDGFLKVIKEAPQMKVDQVIESQSDGMRVRKIAQRMLDEYPELDAIFCTDEITSDLLGEVLAEEAYQSREIRTVCFGMSEQIYGYLQDGVYDASIVQQSFEQGYRAVEWLRQYLNGQAESGEMIHLETLVAGQDFDFENWKQRSESGETL